MYPNSTSIKSYAKVNLGLKILDKLPDKFHSIFTIMQEVDLHDIIKIQTNVIEAAWRNKVKRFLFLGSSCIYPKFCLQPIKEEYLLESSLEQTNQWYALAKISGLKLCEALRKQYGFDAIGLMPTNLYGPGDNYHPQNLSLIHI